VVEYLPKEGEHEGLVFTVSIWQEEMDDNIGHPKTEVVKSSHFPFLDMKMTWMVDGGWGSLV
jgi:hypothetical protein